MTSWKNSGTHKGRPVGIDLFAGAGGLSLGFEQAGFDIAAAVEIDPIHCCAHEYNFPYAETICASVVDLTGKEIRRRAGLEDRDIDVVFGGAPCQGFSLIGKRALDDPRNRLVLHFVRLIRELQPKYSVFENVKGLTLGKHRRFLGEMIEALNSAGYEIVDYEVLNAAAYGVPQDRRRLFLIGVRTGQKLARYPEPRGAATVADAIYDLPDADDFSELLVSDTVPAKFETDAPYARILRGIDADPSDYSYVRHYDRDTLTSSLRTTHTRLSQRRFSETLPGATEPISRFHKLDPEGVCNTIRAGTDSALGAFTSPRPIHPSLPRVITVREAARLHSYPDWFRFHVTKWHGFRQIGNSVPPLLARAVGSEIVRALGVKPRKPRPVLHLGPAGLLSFNMKEAAAHFGVAPTVIAQRRRVASNEQALRSPKNGERQESLFAVDREDIRTSLQEKSSVV
jgi:DNA (cytosine-5)-methyltransferase 1